ncbi:MAG: DNA methyltransferase [Endomicrobium sp.]|nr:DNA methyltransferase [Endomicrobium sp.]
MKVDIFNTSNKYRIIYADPPWQYQDKSCQGAAAKHYKTMTESDICTLPVATISEKDCVLFMWATYPKIEEALKVIKAWGFQYKTIAFQWIKTNKSLRNGGSLFLHQKSFFFGLGRWTRGNSECVLLATKGKPKRESNSVSQLVISPLTRHSEKPQEVRERIKKLMGGGLSIELFARKQEDGWDCWGDEV